MTVKVPVRKPKTVINAEFPLAHRTDLPEHERRVHASVLNVLDRGIESAKTGETFDLGSFAQYATDDEA